MKAISYIACIFLAIQLMSCSKSSDGGGGTPVGPKIPTVTTTVASAITSTSAQSGGSVTTDGGSPVTARGVCWSVVTPNVSDSKTTDGSGTGSFTSSLTNLFPQSVYFVRAYATNSVGTGYGDAVMVQTPLQQSVPTVTTLAPFNIKSTFASTGGDVTADGNATVTAKGICWNTSPNPTIANNIIPYGIGGLGGFSSFINNLTVHTTYYVRAYATNSIGTGYGTEYSFTTVYTIGEGLGGGKIFYLDASNNHGLIAATLDQSGGAKWNHTGNPYAPINAYSTTNGVSNTNNIIAAIGSSGHAAAICRAYTGGGNTDWYLPSYNELALLSQQSAIIGNFQPAFYWSSTASSTYVASAWALNFGSGSGSGDHDKTALYFVRAIRAF